MRTHWIAGVFCMVAVAVACTNDNALSDTNGAVGGNIADGAVGGNVTGGIPNTSEAGGTTTTTALQEGPISLALLSQCTATPQGVRSFASLDDFQTAIIGDWGLCSTSSVFGTREAGLQILTDGRWHKLVAGLNQTAFVATGWGNEGSWNVFQNKGGDNSVTYQLNLLIDGSGTVITIPQLSNVPLMMRLPNMGVHQGDYVHLGP